MPEEKLDIYWNIPVAFHFEVKIAGMGVIPFKEVTGLSSEIELETIFEGGVNDGEYKLPKHVKHSNLVLKRALILLDNAFVTWIKETLYNNLSKPVVPKDIQISLLNQEREPIYNWTCTKAYPVKWETESLDAEKNSILIDSVEFAYSNLKRL